MECLNYAANIRVLPHSTSGCEHLLWMMLTWVGMIIGNYTVHTLISPGYMRPSWEQCRSFSQNSDKYGLTRQLWMPSLVVTRQNEQYGNLLCASIVAAFVLIYRATQDLDFELLYLVTSQVYQ